MSSFSETARKLRDVGVDVSDARAHTCDWSWSSHTVWNISRIAQQRENHKCQRRLLGHVPTVPAALCGRMAHAATETKVFVDTNVQ
jgi:hypothetical protein